MRPTPVLQRAIRRLRLTTKQAGKDYYKGTGTGSMGRHTKHGGYIVDYNKVRTYVCPDLKDFELTPFVSKKISTKRSSAGDVMESEGYKKARTLIKMWKQYAEQYGGTI